MLFPEHGWAVCIGFLFLLLLRLVKLLLGLFVLSHLLLKDIKVFEVATLNGSLLSIHVFCHPLLSFKLFESNLAFRLLSSETLSFTEFRL